MSKKTKGGDDSAQAGFNWNSFKKALGNAYGTPPNDINGQLAYRTAYYKTQLRNIIKGLIEIKECPDTWDKDYFKDVLLFEGRICVTDTTMGVIPLRCNLFGVNVYQRPSGVNIANPVLGNMEREKDADCVIIYLLDDIYFKSLEPIVDIFAEKLASCDGGIDANILNSKVSWIVGCRDEKQAEEMKLIFDKITKGEAAVFADKSTLDVSQPISFFSTSVKQNFVVDLLQTAKRAIMNEFLTAVGVQNSNVEKKERLIVDEVNSNNDEILCNIEYMRDNIKMGVQKVNNMYGDILKIDFPYWNNLEKGVEVNGTQSNQLDRTVRNNV